MIKLGSETDASHLNKVADGLSIQDEDDHL